MLEPRLSVLKLSEAVLTKETQEREEENVVSGKWSC